MSVNVEFCCGFARSHCEAGHVVPCVRRRSQGVRSPHWPKPDQPVVPWTHSVGGAHSDFWKLTNGKCKIMNKCMTCESWLPATSGAAIPAVQSRFGLWSWVMQASTTSGLRQTNHWGDGPPLTPSLSTSQVGPHKPQLPQHLCYDKDVGLFGHISPAVDSCSHVLQTSRSRCIQRGPPTCSALERLCL